MIVAIILAVLGLVLIYMEFFLPGGVMGIAGTVTLLASIVVAFFKLNNSYLIGAFILFACFAIFVDIKIALQRVRKSKGVFLSKDQEGFVASRFKKELLGKEGIAATDLGLSGQILVEDKYVQAASIDGYIKKGKKVRVTGGEGARLFVKEI